MTTAPESVKLLKLFADVGLAHAETYKRGFDPGAFLAALHARGWAITATEPIAAEPARDPQASIGL